MDGKERERAKVSLFHNKIVVRLARGVPQCVGLASIREGCTTRGGAGRGKRKRGFSLSHGGEAGCVNRAHTKRTHAPRHCACPLVWRVPLLQQRVVSRPTVLKLNFLSARQESGHHPLSEVCSHPRDVYVYSVRHERRMAPFRHCANRFPFRDTDFVRRRLTVLPPPLSLSLEVVGSSIPTSNHR